MSGTVLRSGLLLLCILVGSVLLAGFGGKAEAIGRAAPDSLKPIRMAGERQPIAAIGADASGIAWSDHRKSLFAVRNALPQVTELDTGGQLIRNIPLHGFNDVEGITWLNDDRFAVLEERTCTVWLLQLGEGVSHIEKPAQPLFALPALNSDKGNNGCEDLALDPASHTFYLSREKNPAMVVRGIPQPEGITMDRYGNLYVLSEPDLLYTFVR